MSPVVSALSARTRRNPGAPLVTFIDQGSGERTELSATSLANAAAKIANALRDEYELEPGSRIALLLPVHWQLAAWLAGAWTAGMVVTTDSTADVDLVVTTAQAAAGLGRAAALVSLHPFGLPLVGATPAGTHDVTLAVRQQPDAYLFDTPPGSAPALLIDAVEVSGQDVWDAAAGLARTWGLHASGRLLVTSEDLGRAELLAALAVPLAADAAVVLAPGATELDSLRKSEGVTATCGARP